MLKNYLKTAIRNFLKNPLTSFINILGLSIAIGCALVAYAFVNYDMSVDQFHENKDRIYLATSQIDRDGSTQAYGFSPLPLGERLVEDFPEIKRVARIEDRSAIVKHGNAIFSEFVRFTDPDFLQMFTFPLKWGQKTALGNQHEIILSEELSLKYFGEENPIGKAISIDFGEGRRLDYSVGGVAEAFPVHSEFRFHILLNIEQLEQADSEFDPTDWSEFLDATFFELNTISDVSAIDTRMNQYLSAQNDVQTDWPIKSFRSEPFSQIRENSQYIRSTIVGQSDPEGRIVISIIGILLISLACLNYINIAIVSASKRLKEIGIRKVMGGQRSSIIVQFMGENILLTFFACIIGLVLAKALFVPAFDSLFSVGIEFDLTLPQFWISLIGILLITGIVSGAYPAFYISKFDANNIIRGKLAFNAKNKLTKVFLCCQLILSCIALVSSIMFVQNSNYQQQRDWGYNQAQVLVTPVSDYNSFEQLRHELSQYPHILEVAGAKNHIGTSRALAVIEVPDRKFEAMRLDVDEHYVPTMGLRIKNGRNFREELGLDTQHVLVNERMTNALGWENAINQQFRYDSVQYTVVGVLEDHHHNSFFEKIRPTFYRLAAKEDYQYLALKVATGKTRETFDYLKATWGQLFPHLPFEGTFQDQRFDYYFNNIAGHGRLMSFIAFLAIVLSCMGLYGLLSLNIASRMKEFSIRKVLGANLGNMIPLINRQFIWVLGIACILGAPASFYLLRFLFDNVYEYHMPITIYPIIWAILILIALVGLTTFTQIRKVDRINPIEGLRNE